MDCLQGFRREQRLGARSSTGNHQTLKNILVSILLIERRKVGAQCDPLFQRPQFKRVQFQIEFGLTHKHDLKKLPIVRLKVRKQTNLLQELHREVVRLIHDQYRVESLKTSRGDVLSQVK